MIKGYAVQQPGAMLEAFEYDPGDLGDDEVEIDVQYCGICHSDLSMIDNSWGRSSFPLVPGHEVAGVVSAVGSRVQSLHKGQRVGLGWHAGYCNHCRQCHDGDHNLCASAQPTIVGRHGGFANKVRAAANSVVTIPDSVASESAGPLFCAGITVFNPVVEFGVQPTDEVAVIGIGGLGHLALQFLNAWGCRVTAFTSSDSKREEALNMGAHDTINSTNKSDIKQARGRFDFILSTVNVKLDWNLYLSTLAPRGRLNFVGATLEPLDIGVFSMLGMQRSVSASPVGSPATMAAMLEFAGRHGIAPRIEKFPFSKINDAIEHLRNGNPRYRVVLEH